MTFAHAVLTIAKSQDEINEAVFLGEQPYPPDEYFVAVGKILPYLKCLNCMISQSGKDNSGDFIFVPSEPNDDELPFE